MKNPNQAPTKTATATLTLEVLPPPPTSLLPASGVITRADRILAFHEGSRRSAAQQIVYAFLAGAELLAQKEEIGHGGFIKWCEANVPLSHRTINRYTGLAEALQPRLAAIDNFNANCLQLTNGESNKPADIQSIFEAIQQITSAKTITELYRDHGLIPDPTHQKDRAHKTEKLTPEEEEAAKNAQAQRLAHDLIALGDTWHDDHAARGRIDAALRQQIINTCVKVSQQERATLKAQKAKNKTSTAKGAKAAKKKGKGK